MTSASRSNKVDVLNLTERGLEFEDVNAVSCGARDRGHHCQFGSCQERTADPTEGYSSDRCDEDGEAGGSKRQSGTGGRRHEIGIRMGR